MCLSGVGGTCHGFHGSLEGVHDPNTVQRAPVVSGFILTQAGQPVDAEEGFCSFCLPDIHPPVFWDQPFYVPLGKSSPPILPPCDFCGTNTIFNSRGDHVTPSGDLRGRHPGHKTTQTNESALGLLQKLLTDSFLLRVARSVEDKPGDFGSHLEILKGEPACDPRHLSGEESKRWREIDS